MTIVAKLGSSIVADPHGDVRGDVLDRVCAQVAELHHRGEQVVMVTSGAIAMGMRVMDMEARPRSVDELQALSAIGQGTLFRAYEGRLAAGGVHAAQILLTSSDVEARVHYLNARNALRRIVAWGAVPVINENDTTATDEITFGDNDFLSAQVAILLQARLLVLLTDQEGLHSADPRHDPGAELIRDVSDADQLGAYSIGDRTSLFGSGGMRSKVTAATMASDSGIEAVICAGTRDGTLLAAAAGEQVGTKFAPRRGVKAGYKLWLRHAKPARGTVEVDDGAARVLREQGSSLLPVGIVAVEGTFEAGDAVDVACAGEAIGKGIVNYSSAELEQIKGLRSDRVAELMPHAAAEAVHRDSFVLTG